MTDLRESAIALLGTWGRPADLPSKLAVGVAAAFALAAIAKPVYFFGVGARDPDEERFARRLFLAVTAFVAALLSLGYIAAYLRGGPRIVDATTYFLQGRALAQGDLAWTPLEPSASFRGRFLLYRELREAGESSLGGIFPPGYPLLLAVGFFVHAPMVVGPLLAGGLVVTTYYLARELAASASSVIPPASVEPVARAAALFSLVCGALRYHTADTMSHGATALGVAVALVLAIRARRDPRRRTALFAGLAAGFVLATRPFSTLPLVLVMGWLLRGRSPSDRRRAISYTLAGAVPGLLLLLLSQRAVTGSWIVSTQRMYYALSDGPPGCFRWGFGPGTGCLVEHGEFVAARLARGYGLLEAAGTTLRRLRMHLTDVANLEPLALLVAVPLLRARSSLIKAASALVGLQILTYAPFYFDGNYPGAGARFFAEVLPIEHALIAIAIATFATEATAYVRAALGTLAVAAAGFAIHASFEHGKLRDRDGGRPMFEPDVLAKANVTTGLVFVDTDHGFALGHDPAARVRSGVVVARLRGDDRDRLLFDALDHPPTFLYHYDVSKEGVATPRVAGWSPPDLGDPLRFEAEAEWPALAQKGGFAAPAWTDACASGSRALVLTPSEGTARVAIDVPAPKAGKWSVGIRVVHGARLPFTENTAPGAGSAEARVGRGRWTWKERSGTKPTCEDLPAQVVELSPPHVTMTLEARGGPIAIDRVTLRPVR